MDRPEFLQGPLPQWQTAAGWFMIHIRSTISKFETNPEFEFQTRAICGDLLRISIGSRIWHWWQNIALTGFRRISNGGHAAVSFSGADSLADGGGRGRRSPRLVRDGRHQ